MSRMNKCYLAGMLLDAALIAHTGKWYWVAWFSAWALLWVASPVAATGEKEAERE